MKKIPSEIKFFLIDVILVMAYVFSLVYVVTVVYNGAVLSTSRMFSVVCSTECVISF